MGDKGTLYEIAMLKIKSEVDQNSIYNYELKKYKGKRSILNHIMEMNAWNVGKSTQKMSGFLSNILENKGKQLFTFFILAL